MIWAFGCAILKLISVRFNDRNVFSCVVLFSVLSLSWTAGLQISGAKLTEKAALKTIWRELRDWAKVITLHHNLSDGLVYWPWGSRWRRGVEKCCLQGVATAWLISNDISKTSELCFVFLSTLLRPSLFERQLFKVGTVGVFFGVWRVHQRRTCVSSCFESHWEFILWNKILWFAFRGSSRMIGLLPFKHARTGLYQMFS